MGVSIDIFPLDNLNEKTQKKDVKKVHVYNTLGMLAANTRFEKSNHGPLVTLVKYGVQLFAKIFGWKFWINKAIKRSIKYNNKQCRLVSLYDSTLERCNFEKEIFDKVVNIKFEDAEFPIMAEFDKYLTISYGDYMTPPPKEEQVSPHKFNAYYK